MGKIMYQTRESRTDAFIVLAILWTLFCWAYVFDVIDQSRAEIMTIYVNDPAYHEHSNAEVIENGLYFGDDMDTNNSGCLLPSSDGNSDISVYGSNYIRENSTEVGELHTLIGTEDSDEQIAEEIRDGEIEMLAQLIEAEAGNQDYHGKCLVADVVLNRIYSTNFPDSVEDVIMEYHTDKKGIKHYQFSTVIDGKYDEAAWYISDDSRKAAYQEYMADNRIDCAILSFTAGAYNPYFTPAYKYGDHYFGY